MLRYFDNFKNNKHLPYVIFDKDDDNRILAMVADPLIVNTIIMNTEGEDPSEFNSEAFLESNRCSIVDNHVSVYPEGWDYIN